VAAEPDTGLITDERLTKAAGIDNSDPAVAEQFLDREGEPCTWYGDSAYGTGDLRGAINDAEHQAVIKPKPLPAPVPGGFTIDDFTVDETAGTVTCPAGNTRPISRTRVATFGALCRDCPLRQRCTKSNTGRKIILRDRDDLLRQARRDWVANPALRDNSGAQRARVTGQRVKIRMGRTRVRIHLPPTMPGRPVSTTMSSGSRSRASAWQGSTQRIVEAYGVQHAGGENRRSTSRTRLSVSTLASSGACRVLVFGGRTSAWRGHHRGGQRSRRPRT
jgi:hypothetical protein